MKTGNDFKFNKRDLNFLIKLKARDFRQHDIHNITEQQIKDYLFDCKWKQRDSIPMCEIVDDITILVIRCHKRIEQKGVFVGTIFTVGTKIVLHSVSHIHG